MAKLENFPSVENVHEVLSDLNKLFKDRNALLNSMWREDKYKEFLLAENIQQLVEADKRDDAKNNRIRADLADGYEVLKARTTLKKFSNFLSPAAIPPLDLDTPIEQDDLDDASDDIEEEASAKVEKEQPQQGPKGDKGDTGSTGATPPRTPAPNININQPAQSQAPSTKLAKGGLAYPSTWTNFLNPGAQRPEEKGSSKSLESIGLVGDKNPASELTEDLGLDKYKKALTQAMGLPLKAVAAGLAGLLENINMPGEEYENTKQQIAQIAQAFDIPKPKASSVENNFSNVSNQEQLIAQGGPIESLKQWFGLAKDRDHGVSDKTFMGNTINNMQKHRQRNEMYMQMLNSGGPSLMPGGKEPLDNLSTSVNTTIDNSKSSISSIAGAAKSMSTNMSSFSNTMTSILSQTLGGIQPAEAGSTVHAQNINQLTNQVINENESLLFSNTEVIQAGAEEAMEQARAQMNSIAASVSQAKPGIGSKNPVLMKDLSESVSRYMVSAISIVSGGETGQDIL